MPKKRLGRFAAIEARKSMRPRTGALPEGYLWFEDPEEAPNPKQWEFLLSRAPTLFYGGSKGGGKTRALIWKMTAYAIDYPGIPMALGRRHATEVKANVLDPASDYWARLSAAYKLNINIRRDPKNDMWRVTFGSEGSFIDIRSFHDPAKIQGVGYSVIGIDEAGQLDDQSLTEIWGRVRGGLFEDKKKSSVGWPRQKLLTANYAPGWLNDRIVQPWKNGTLGDDFKGAVFINCSTLDLADHYARDAARNVGNVNFIDELVASKLYTMEEIADGWLPPEGTVWRPLNEKGDDRDIISMFEFIRDFGPITEEDSVYFGLDHGINHPSTVVAGVFRKSKATGKDVFIVFAEWSEPLDDRPHSYLASVIARLIMPAREHFGWVDSRMKHGQNQIGNGTMAPIFQIMAAGISCMPAPCCKPNQKALSIHAVAEAVANHAVLFVREGTEKLRRQWVGYMKAGASAKPGADPCLPAPDSTNDHLLDAFRYCISGLVASDRISVSTRVVLGLAEKEPGAKTSMEMLEERATEALATQQHRAPVDMRAARQYELSGRMPEPQSVGMPFVGDSLRRDW